MTKNGSYYFSGIKILSSLISLWNTPLECIWLTADINPRIILDNNRSSKPLTDNSACCKIWASRRWVFKSNPTKCSNIK
jgi:hypothetical protein